LDSNHHDLSLLIKGAQDGDEQAMSELITIHKGLVFTLIYRMTNDYEMSQDLSQDTFIKAFLNIHKVKGEKHFRAWLCTIARNIARDYLRKLKRKPTISLEETNAPVAQSDIKNTRRQIIIQDALARLNEHDRMLLTLAYFQGFKLSEVAQATKVSEKSIKVRLFRARQRLRKELRGYEHELLSSY
jgi:RNA polymerase sigma factor (sigma-70 family)